MCNVKGEGAETNLGSFGSVCLSTGSAGMHQRDQPQANVPAVPGLAGTVENQQN